MGSRKKYEDFIELVDDSKIGEIGNALQNGWILKVYIDAIRKEEQAGKDGIDNDDPEFHAGVDNISECEDEAMLIDDEDEKLMQVRQKGERGRKRRKRGN